MNPLGVPVLAMLLMLVAAAVPGGAARAEACVAPQSTELPIRVLRDAPLVTATIDGKPATLLLDSGAEDTVLSPQAAVRLGLVSHYEYPRQMGGVGGTTSSGVAATRSFAVGQVDAPGFRVMIGPVALPDLEGTVPDGLLGGDFLRNFAVDLNLPDGRVTLYRPQCLAGDAPVWQPPFAAITANLSLHNHLFFPVTLDGRQLYAFIDTGAQRSVVDRGAALATGVTPEQLAAGPVAMLRGATAATVSAQLHRFGELRLGDIVVRDPVFGVTPLDLVDADIVLGEDFIQTRRIWLSYAAAPPQIFIEGR